MKKLLFICVLSMIGLLCTKSEAQERNPRPILSDTTITYLYNTYYRDGLLTMEKDWFSMEVRIGIETKDTYNVAYRADLVHGRRAKGKKTYKGGWKSCKVYYEPMQDHVGKTLTVVDAKTGAVLLNITSEPLYMWDDDDNYRRAGDYTVVDLGQGAPVKEK